MKNGLSKRAPTKTAAGNGATALPSTLPGHGATVWLLRPNPSERGHPGVSSGVFQQLEHQDVRWGRRSAKPRGTHKETAREANLLVRPAALAAHASSGGTRLHADQQDHGGSNAPTREGVHGLFGAERRVEDRPCRVLISNELSQIKEFR